MATRHDMTLLGMEHLYRETYPGMEEAGAMKEEARRPGRSSVAADKLYMESRQRAAADGQPRNAGLYASQQYDSGCVLAALTCKFHALCPSHGPEVLRTPRASLPIACRGMTAIAPAMQDKQ